MTLNLKKISRHVIIYSIKKTSVLEKKKNLYTELPTLTHQTIWLFL